MIKFTGQFEKALEYAILKHKGQYRKNSNMPYYWHVMCVAKNVEDNKKSTNLELLLVAAILHDTYEDCKDVTLEEIAKLFGYKVAALVDELSSDKEEIKKIGKTEYLKQKMAKMSSYALVIKLSDRLDNVKDLDTCSEKFQNKYARETYDILAHLKQCGRKLTKTHLKLMKKIRLSLSGVTKMKEEMDLPLNFVD